jgi:hypothetical protein
MRIRLAENFRALFYAPFYAARALGLLADEGVEVEWLGSAAPGEGVAGLLQDAVDLSWGGPMRVMKDRDTRADSSLVCFCEVVGRDPFCLIGPRQESAFRLGDLPRLKFGAVAEVPTPWSLSRTYEHRRAHVSVPCLRKIEARTRVGDAAVIIGAVAPLVSFPALPWPLGQHGSTHLYQFTRHLRQPTSSRTMTSSKTAARHCRRLDGHAQGDAGGS